MGKESIIMIYIDIRANNEFIEELMLIQYTYKNTKIIC
jgi:hypothetical protein